MTQAGNRPRHRGNFSGPGRMPHDLVQKVNADVVRALSSPDTKQRLAEQGIEAVSNTPEQFTAFMQAEVAKWAKVVKDSGASVE